MGGDPKGKMIELDAAYHQMITNEFRSKYAYGKGKLDIATRLQYMNEVYSKYPLPYKSSVPEINPIPFSSGAVNLIKVPNYFQLLQVNSTPQINISIKKRWYNL